jgi:GNAT superfamily N-acetyltransferase|tara:strand:+ start:78 stop:785 length:708 start_codon:yes stop_codon:yes gene_type:complete
MKKILNNWRKFLISEGNVRYTPDSLEPVYSLFHDTDGETHQLVLYQKEKYVDSFYVIGYASVDLLTDTGDERFNCIPDTYQVSAIYVEPEMQGKGFGKLLYSLAFAAIGQDSGLTSDKYSGTLDKAKGVWKKMEKSAGFEKRKTPSGNDKFDYDGKSTPDDKMDDCGTDMDLGDTNATDHSLKKTNNITGQQIFTAYKKNHNNNDFMNRADVEYRLLSHAIKRFGQIYTSSIMGV